ncbi:MAG: hydantoinase B/oxoprolinase family protein [Gammaproteobacteria bacterium]|nr:hydantoinase B/oxoprolinase family protein [Gammaproteobacteria bacterium]MBI5616023.1 hydantoinase B/oxoprolinase family protein [Gammaproteobacteria bacterium]
MAEALSERGRLAVVPYRTPSPTLRERLAERDRLTAETGHYCGVTTLSLRDADPIKYERFYNKLHAAVLAARESARFVAASPGSREMGESLWGLTTPEGDTLAVSLGFLSHTAIFPVSIRYMADHDYDVNDGIEDGDVYAVSDGKTGGVPHPGDFYSFVSICEKDELVGWAVGINHLMENGAPVAGSWATFSVDTFMDGLVCPPMRTGRKLKQESWWKAIWERRTRAATMNILDDKMRLAGCAMINAAVHKLIQEFGIDYYKRAIREIIEESRRMVVDNMKSLMVPGTYNGCAFRLVKYQGLQQVWSHADKNTLIHVRASVEPNEKGLKLDTEGSSRWGYHSYNATPGGVDCAVFLGMINSFAHNTKVTAGIELAVERHYPEGSIYNPDYEFTSNSNLWAQTVSLNSICFNAISKASFARGYLEEAFTVDGNWGAFQGAGTTTDGTTYGFTNFEWLGGTGRGAWCYKDGEPLVWAAWSQLATIGDAEEFESCVPPLFYLGRKLLPGYFGYGKYRGGPGNSAVHWCVEPGKHVALTRPNGGLSCTTSSGLGMSGAYPGPGSFMISARGTNLPDLIAKGETPRDARELLAQIDAGELTVRNLEIWKTDCPELALKDHDLYVDAAGSSGGWGDPLDRDPLLVIRDLDDGMTPDYAFVNRMFGVVATQAADGSWQLDAAATAAQRKALRAARLAESQDPAEWWATERKQVLAQDFVPEVREMYAQSLSFAKFDREFRDFWQVPEAFKFSAE